MRMFALSFLILCSSSVFATPLEWQVSEEQPEIDHPFQNYQIVNVNEFEMYEVSQNKGFPEKKVRAFDPINKKHYQKVLVGPTQKAGFFKSYDFWRYVTVYNVEPESERISYLPYFFEDCHDNSFFMAQWDESRTIKVTFKSDIGFSKLGLSASVGMSLEQGVTFSSSRRVRAVEGIQAKHYPVKLSETHRGVTYIQTYTKSKRQFGYILPSRWEQLDNSYPHEFVLDNQNVGFRVVREIEKECPGYDADKDPVNESALYLNGGRTK